MSGKIGQALLSVTDKRGLETFARGLLALGVTLIASGGTRRFLLEKDIQTKALEELTHSPEMLGGRVKTLHPSIFGGILARRDAEDHMAQLSSLGILPIDLVAVNLYPFEATVSRTDVDLEDAIEQIDIGGPSLIRASAKNFKDVVIVVDPDDYGTIIRELKGAGDVSPERRRDLALKAFSVTSAYDTAIFNWARARFHPQAPWEASMRIRLEKLMDTRYGENPHQKGAYFVDPAHKGISASNSDILWGKELSFNNIYDIDAATDILMEFPDQPSCVIIKHNNPSGVASCGMIGGRTASDVFMRALDCDPLSAFGGIVGLNVEVDLKAAEQIGARFFEVVVAPSFSEDALKELMKKKNLRILRTNRPIVQTGPVEQRYVKVKGGLLVQTMDWPPFDPAQWKVVTRKAPSEGQIRDLVFAMKVVKHVKSNCVVLAKDECTTGIGAGQMSRVDSCFMAIHKAGKGAHGSVLASDAFFPFRDGVDTLAGGGVTAIAQPGGSIRDAEVIEAADQHGMVMMFTGLRQFKH